MSALPSSYAQPPTSGIWTSLNRFLAVLIAVTVLAVVFYRYVPELGERRKQEARIESLKAEIEQQKQLQARHTLEENLLMRDSEYIGLIARDKLDLMREGETIYRIEATRPDPSKMRLKQ